MKKIFLGLIIFCSLIDFVFAGDIESIYFKGESPAELTQLSLKYKGKEYAIQQYQRDWNDWGIFSLQYWPPEGKGEPEGLVLVVDAGNKIVKELTSAEYHPDIVLYSLDNNHEQDLILFWRVGAHSTTVEVWKTNHKQRELKKAFEEFTDKNVFFRTVDGVPALAFKREYPINVVADNFPDSDFDFYKWNSKTFVGKVSDGDRKGEAEK